MNYRKYKNQVRLLLSILPMISQEDCLALHGGTAINLFHANMPRLSVNIDLTYVPIEDRDSSLTAINRALATIGQKIEHTFPEINVEHKKRESKLMVSNKEALIKVEVNQIKRGCYADSTWMELCAKAQQEFDLFSEMKVVESGHLYGGKICAALDRQHPRDLFDIKYMLQQDQFNEGRKKGFLFYLVSSNRPIAEMLAPQYKDQKSVFENQFAGMTEEPFSYQEYEETRENLVRKIHEFLTIEDQQFLLSVEEGYPDWSLYDFEVFPAVQWKLKNVQRLIAENPKKHLMGIKKLRTLFTDLNKS